MNRLLERVAQRMAPRWAARRGRLEELRDSTRRLKALCSGNSDLGRITSEVLSHDGIRPIQKKSEFEELLRLVRDLRPRSLCEIGGYSGGSLFLFCRVAAPDAKLLSVDLEYRRSRMAVYREFGEERQRVTCMAADSHTDKTLRRVERWLDGDPLDFLFIDGDHSLEGVKSDFEMYAPLVRRGGLVAFHDIVPDFRTRHGADTGADTGGVPEFWESLKRRYPDGREIVEDPDQDGFGIGVVEWEG